MSDMSFGSVRVGDAFGSVRRTGTEYEMMVSLSAEISMKPRVKRDRE